MQPYIITFLWTCKTNKASHFYNIVPTSTSWIPNIYKYKKILKADIMHLDIGVYLTLKDAERAQKESLPELKA